MVDDGDIFACETSLPELVTSLEGCLKLTLSIHSRDDGAKFCYLGLRRHTAK